MRVLILIIVGLVTAKAEVVNLNNDPMFSNFFTNYFQLWDQNKKSPTVGDSTQREVSVGGATSKSYLTKTGPDGIKTTTQTTTSADGSQITVQTIISPNGSKTVNTVKKQNKMNQLEPTRNVSNSIEPKQGAETSNTILSDGIKNILSLNETRPVSQMRSIQGSKSNSINLTQNNKTILRNDPIGSTVTQTKIDPDGKTTVTKTTISPQGRKTVSIQTTWDSKMEIPEQNKPIILNSTTKNSYMTQNKSVINSEDKSADLLNQLKSKINNRSNQTFQQKWKAELSQHNLYRVRHGIPALLYSAQLSQIAQSFAQKLSSIRGMVLYHSGNTFQGQSAGQNLYRASYDPSGGQATDSWYNEIKQYGWDGQFSSATGHFTQLVWKDSKYVGFGFSGGVVVANYYPAGNYIGRFQQNVLRPLN